MIHHWHGRLALFNRKDHGIKAPGISVVSFPPVLYIQLMSMEMLEQQLAGLQRRVETLEAKADRVSKDAWRELIGWEKDDALFRDAVRLGAEWREQANRDGK